MKHKYFLILLQVIGFLYWLKIIIDSSFLQKSIKLDNVCTLLIGSIFYILLFVLSIKYIRENDKLKHLFLIMNIIFLSTLIYGKLKGKLLVIEKFYGIYKPIEKLTLCQNIYFNIFGFKIYDSIENRYLTISQYQSLYEKYYKRMVVNSKNPIKIKLTLDLKPFVTTMLWNQTFKEKHKWVASLSYLKNNTIIVAGNNYSQKYGAWLMKIDNRGNKIWEKIFQRNDNVYANFILPLKDRDFIVVGYAKNTEKTGKYKPWIAKIDNKGDAIWDRTYPKIDISKISSATSTKDGGAIVVANLTSVYKKGVNEYGLKYNPLIFKIDSRGNIKWKKIFKDKNGEINTVTIKNNRCIAGGYIYPKGDKSFKAWVAVIDKDGSIIKEKIFENKHNSYINTIDVMKNSNLIMAGAINFEYEKSSNAWVVIIDSNGNIVKEKVFNMKYNSEFYTMASIKDNKFILAAFTWSKCDDIRRRWLVVFPFAPLVLKL